MTKIDSTTSIITVLKQDATYAFTSSSRAKRTDQIHPVPVAVGV